MRFILTSTLVTYKISAKQIIANQSVVDAWFQKSHDDMYQMFENQLSDANSRLSMALSRSSSPEELQAAESYLNQLRRFRQLKEFVIWMSRVPKFGKYCYYGCWCLPGGAHEDVAGKGEPRDEIDSACKLQTQCYECANIDPDTRDGCNPDKAKYAYTFSQDENNPNDVLSRDITCHDKWIDEPGGNKKSHCRRAVCECDRGLAYRLRTHEESWDLKYHRKWATPGFDAGLCEVQRNGGGNGGGNGNRNPRPVGRSSKKCCGDYADDGNRYTFEDLGGYRQCCGTKTYNTQSMACCNEDLSTVKAAGTC